jgi:hypothetical protein
MAISDPLQDPQRRRVANALRGPQAFENQLQTPFLPRALNPAMEMQFAGQSPFVGPQGQMNLYGPHDSNYQQMLTNFNRRQKPAKKRSEPPAPLTPQGPGGYSDQGIGGFTPPGYR